MNWAERISIFAVGTWFGWTAMVILSMEYWNSIPIRWSSNAVIISFIISMGMIIGLIWLIFGKKEEK